MALDGVTVHREETLRTYYQDLLGNDIPLTEVFEVAEVPSRVPATRRCALVVLADGSGPSGTTIRLAATVSTQGQAIAFSDVVVLEGASVVRSTADGDNFTFFSTVDGTHDLVLDARTGNLGFLGPVGTTAVLGNVTIQSALGVSISDAFRARDVDVTYSGTFETSEVPRLDVASLALSPSATGARLFGIVAGAAGNAAATAVTGPVGDAEFTINGCVIGEVFVCCVRPPSNESLFTGKTATAVLVAR